MPIRDGFDPNHPLPFFLSGHADEHEERGSLLLLNASILVLVASLVGMAILLSSGNPAKVFADIKASLTDISALQPDTVQTTPTAWGAPARDEIATTFDTAHQSQAEIRAAPPGALLKQFQDWAAKEDARAQIETVRPAQDARAQVLQSAESPSEGPAGSKCAGGGSGRPGCPSTEPVRAKCPGTISLLAKPRLA